MSIFVSVASYRDASCPGTIQSMYDNASVPSRVYAGICQQNNDTDSDCLTESLKKIPKDLESNISIIRLKHTEAKGPTYARYLCSTLYKGQDYYLQVDSHTLFVKGWDASLIGMLKEIVSAGLSNRPVISHYPAEEKDYKDSGSGTKEVPRICKSFFNKEGVLSLRGAEIMDTEGTYYQTPYIAAGMFFAPGSIVRDVPFDPHLHYLFTGEEILLSMRFYTAGYDVFTPTQNIVYHKYTRDNEPKFWDDITYKDDNAKLRMKHILGVVPLEKVPTGFQLELQKYGAGNQRSISDFFNFAKIDLEAERVMTNFCRDNNEADEEDVESSKENFIHLHRMCSSKKCRAKAFLLYGITFLTFLSFVVLFVIVFRKLK